MTQTTYKKTNSPTAIYGESSAAVLKLQQDLNAKGAGLTLDSKYGPLTQAAFTKFNNQTTTTPPATPNRTITPTTKVDPARFERTANSNDRAIRDLEGNLNNAYNVDAPDLAKITEQKREASNSLVDSIRAEFARVIEMAVKGVAMAVKGLRDTKNYKDVLKSCVEVNSLETLGDKMRDDMLGEGFEKYAADPVSVIKWKEIYQDAETVLDICEDVVHIVESILVKQA